MVVSEAGLQGERISHGVSIINCGREMEHDWPSRYRKLQKVTAQRLMKWQISSSELEEASISICDRIWEKGTTLEKIEMEIPYSGYFSGGGGGG